MPKDLTTSIYTFEKLRSCEALYVDNWFTTGTPTALLHLMKTQSLNLPEALETPVQQNFFEAFEVDRIDAKTLMYQTGYLTLAQKLSKYQSKFSTVPLSNYYLDFPNYEVRSSFNEHLLNYYGNVPLGSSYEEII